MNMATCVKEGRYMLDQERLCEQYWVSKKKFECSDKID